VKELIAVAVGGTIVMNILIAGYVESVRGSFLFCSKLRKLVIYVGGKIN
jgi:hypothetical protein